MTEVVEQDTHDNEDIKNIKDFLLQDLLIEETSFLQFSFGYNKRIFDGWVKQPSACCGAASIAGAWNALCCYHRNEHGAISHMDVLRIYHSMFIDIVDRYTRAFERRLGASLGSLMEQIEEELKKKGREIGGRKGFHASKVMVMNALKRLARVRLGNRPLMVPNNPDEGNISIQKETEGVVEEMAPPSLPDITFSSLMVRDALDCIIELFEGDGVVFMPEIHGGSITEDKDSVVENGGGNEVVVDEEDEEDETGGGDDEEEEKMINTVVAKGKKGSVGKGQWDWKKDFMSIVKNIAGKRKITAVRPSTAAIGNWGILQGVERLSEWMGLGTHLQARLFMGKRRTTKTKLDVILSRKDDMDMITHQWDALKSTLNRSDTVLLFHLKNHYALIFAYREWLVFTPSMTTGTNGGIGSSVVGDVVGSSSGGEISKEVDSNGSYPCDSNNAENQINGVYGSSNGNNHNNGSSNNSSSISVVPIIKRQLLAARKGQRPTAWIDFDEARETMLGWEGYKIMAISSPGVNIMTLRQASLVIPEEYQSEVIGNEV